MSSPSAPLHQAHSELSTELLRLVDATVSPSVVGFLVDRVAAAVDFGLDRPSSSARAAGMRDTEFADFAATVLRRAEVRMPVVLGALVYIDRATPHLRIAIEEWACHRVFLGALILASKYLNDSSLKNAHWALCTGVFGRRDIGRIEREFLEVLDFELAVHAAHLRPLHAALAARTAPPGEPEYARERAAKRPRRLPRTPRRAASPVSSDSASPCTPCDMHFPRAPLHAVAVAAGDTSPGLADEKQPSTLALLDCFPLPLPPSSSAVSVTDSPPSPPSPPSPLLAYLCPARLPHKNVPAWRADVRYALSPMDGAPDFEVAMMH